MDGSDMEMQQKDYLVFMRLPHILLRWFQRKKIETFVRPLHVTSETSAAGSRTCVHRGNTHQTNSTLLHSIQDEHSDNLMEDSRANVRCNWLWPVLTVWWTINVDSPYSHSQNDRSHAYNWFDNEPAQTNNANNKSPGKMRENCSIEKSCFQL